MNFNVVPRFMGNWIIAQLLNYSIGYLGTTRLSSQSLRSLVAVVGLPLMTKVGVRGESSAGDKVINFFISVKFLPIQITLQDVSKRHKLLSVARRTFLMRA